MPLCAIRGAKLPKGDGAGRRREKNATPPEGKLVVKANRIAAGDDTFGVEVEDDVGV